MKPLPARRGLPTPLVVWLVGSMIYAAAVAQRSTIGVSLEAAAHRYGVSIAALSLLPVTQLLVYAVLQLPAGSMLDRFGARRTLTIGAFAIASGQLVLALSNDLVTACASRILVSVGDSVAFVSVLRLVILRLPAPKATLLAQLTGALGQIGAAAAAAPFLLLLQTWTWSPAFLMASGVGVFAAFAAFIAIREAPPSDYVEAQLPVRALWRDPGVRLGYWTHFTMTFPTTGFLLYWGMPFLLSCGFTPSGAGTVISFVSVAGIAAGLTIAVAIFRWPNRGFLICVSVSIVCIVFWLSALSTRTTPNWLVVATALITGACAPCGVVAFKFLRPAYANRTSSLATGLVNSGGFTGSFLAICGVAFVSAAGTRAGLTEPMRVGLAAQLGFWAIGLWLMLHNFREFRRRVKSDAGH